MKKYIFFIACLNFIIIKTQCQVENLGAVSLGMGGIFATSVDFWSSMNNQAGLAFMENPAVGIGYNNEFFIKELSTKYAGGALPVVKNGVMGFMVSQFGYTLLNQTKFGLSYAMKFSENFQGGIQFDYFHLKLGDIYGSTGAFTFELGGIYKLSENWIIGTHLFNPAMVKLAEYDDERMTTTATAGVAFIVSEQVSLSGEIQKAMEHKASLRFGMNYNIVEAFSLRAGVASKPTKISFGFGINFINFELDFAFSYHEVLGFSPSTGIIYRFNKPEKENVE